MHKKERASEDPVYCPLLYGEEIRADRENQEMIRLFIQELDEGPEIERGVRWVDMLRSDIN